MKISYVNELLPSLVIIPEINILSWSTIYLESLEKADNIFLGPPFTKHIMFITLMCTF